MDAKCTVTAYEQSYFVNWNLNNNLTVKFALHTNNIY